MQTFMRAENNFVELSFTNKELLERILSSVNLSVAYKRVAQNGGNGGVNETTHKNELIASLLTGSYRPNPAQHIEIPKDNGGKCQLGIPTIVD